MKITRLFYFFCSRCLASSGSGISYPTRQSRENWRTSKMAAQVKQMLNSLSNAGGSHKDITGKYREILEKIFKFQEPSLTEGLKAFIEAGKFDFMSLIAEQRKKATCAIPL